MKLLELIPLLHDYTRIKRNNWDFFLVKPDLDFEALIRIDLYSIQIGEYKLSYQDLLADDWERME